MPNPAVPPPATEPALAVVLTCTGCQRTYEPTTEDFVRGRTGCPDPDCGGWTYTASLTAPATGGAR
jgi:hypothetical protein